MVRDLGALLEDLQAAGRLAHHDVLVVEGVHQHRPGLVGPGPGLHQGLVDGGAVEADLGAVAAGGLLLHDRGAVGHVDDRADAEHLRGQRDALGVVAGAGGHDAAGPFLGAEARHAHVGAADLEGAGALEVLGLEEDRSAGDLGEPARLLHRRVDGHVAQQVGGRLDLGEGGTDLVTRAVRRVLRRRARRPARRLARGGGWGPGSRPVGRPSWATPYPSRCGRYHPRQVACIMHLPATLETCRPLPPPPRGASPAPRRTARSRTPSWPSSSPSARCCASACPATSTTSRCCPCSSSSTAAGRCG